MMKTKKVIVPFLIVIILTMVQSGLVYAENIDYTYDESNRLMQTDKIQFIYDNNGNLVEKMKIYRDNEIPYIASSDFSSNQGGNFWCYQEWDGKEYKSLEWDDSLKQWKGSQYWLRVAREFQHPDGNDSVRKWVAPKRGEIKITGKVAKMEGQVLGDGVQVKVMKNEVQMWPSSGWHEIAFNDTQGIDVNITTEVEKGDSIYFIVNQKQTIDYDGTYWNPNITYITSSAIKEFSPIQGDGNWYYQEWNGKEYKDLTWNADLKQWQGSTFWLRIAREFQHPDGNDSVRKWIAPKNGKIYIAGKVAKLEGQIYGDGVRIKIKKNRTQIWPSSEWENISYNDTKGVNISLVTEVEKGDSIYFIVNQNQTIDYDTTYWNPTIMYIPSVYNGSKEFSTIQGKDNWYYQEWDGKEYKNLTWNDELKQWQGSSYWLRIAQDFMHPDGNDVVRTWVSPRKGSLQITGNVAKLKGQVLGDGVRVKIMKNKSQMWPVTGWHTISSDDIKGSGIKISVEVEKGDSIYFIVNQNQTMNYDGTSWNIALSLFP